MWPIYVRFWDVGYLRILVYTPTRMPFVFSAWRQGRQWEVHLGWLELRWRVHHGHRR